MCRYLRNVVIQDVVIPEGFCVAVNGEKFWEINVVISDMSLYPMSLYAKFTVHNNIISTCTCSIAAGKATAVCDCFTICDQVL